MANKIRVYGKAQNRTSLGIIHAYMVMYPQATLEDLRKAFPNELNPDKGVKENFIDVDQYEASSNWDGYFKEDGFTKRKNLGRVERIDPATGEGVWKAIHDKWLYLYQTRKEEVGLSAIQKVSFEDEWCAEAYMETDYSNLSEKDFIKKMVDYSAFLVQNEEI